MNLMSLFMLVVVVSSLWVGFDVAGLSIQARRKGLMTTDGPDWVLALVMGTVGFMFCWVLWLIAFPAYLYYRPRFQAALAGGPEALPKWLKRRCPGCKAEAAEAIPYCPECGASLPPLR